MKNNEDPRHLEHMRKVQAERRAQAILRQRNRQHVAALAMARIAGASRSTVTEG